MKSSICACIGRISEYLKRLIHSPLSILTLILPPIAVMGITLAVFAVNGMYPFGDKTLAWCDMHQQVLPLLLDFKDILEGEGDFFFNWQNAAGMNFLGVFLFFISSPFSLLVAFVDKADMVLFMNIMTVMKLMVCAVTANAYFRVCHKMLHPFYGAALSVMYAFSGYSMMFYQNTVWLDVMYFFPILLISFDRLIKKRKSGLLIFCLVGMLVLNYYLSYMVVLFTVLYFGVYLFINRKKNVKGIAPRFAVACIIAALISAVIWLPSFAQYLSSARGANIIDGLMKSDLFAPIYTNLPLIFATAFSVAGYIIFFGKRKSKNSRFYAVMCLLMLLPVILEPINKMWHTGDYMAFPMRYGYITTLMMMTYAAHKLKSMKPYDYAEKSKKPYLLLFAASVLVGVFSVWYFFANKTELDSYSTTLWGDADSMVLLLIMFCLFAAVYVLALAFGVFKKLSFRAVGTVLAATLCFECFFNANVYIGAAAYTPTTYNKAIALEDKIPEDDDFYRVKLSQAQRKYFDANLIGGLGYPTIAHYTSLTSENYMFAMKKLGYSSYWMEVTGNGGTWLTDSILSIKYYIERFSAKQPVVFRNKDYSIYESEFYLPLGIVTDFDLSSAEELPQDTRINIQEYVARTLLSAKQPLFTEYQPTGMRNVSFEHKNDMYYFTPQNNSRIATLTYKLHIDGKQSLYFDCFDTVSRRIKEHINDCFAIYVDGIKVDLSFPNKDSNGLLYLGEFEDEDVSIDVDVIEQTYCSSFGVYGLSHEKLDETLKNADTAALTVDGGNISGTATADGDGSWLFLAVPYDEGFTAYVNGEETEVVRALTGFTAIQLDGGENEISISFTAKGMKIGIVLTVTGLLLLLAWIFFSKKLTPLLLKLDGLCRIGVYVLSGGVLLAVYIIPMILNVAGIISSLAD